MWQWILLGIIPCFVLGAQSEEGKLQNIKEYHKSLHLFLEDWLSDSYDQVNLTEAQQKYYSSLSTTHEEDGGVVTLLSLIEEQDSSLIFNGQDEATENWFEKLISGLNSFVKAALSNDGEALKGRNKRSVDEDKKETLKPIRELVKERLLKLRKPKEGKKAWNQFLRSLKAYTKAKENMRNKNRSKNRSKNGKLKSLKSASETKTVIQVSEDSAETSQGEGTDAPLPEPSSIATTTPSPTTTTPSPTTTTLSPTTSTHLPPTSAPPIPVQPPSPVSPPVQPPSVVGGPPSPAGSPPAPFNPPLEIGIPLPDPDKEGDIFVGNRRRKRDLPAQNPERRSYQSLSQQEKERFGAAMNWLMTQQIDGMSKYDIFVTVHRRTYSAQFYDSCVYNRQFIYKFEHALQEYDASIHLPYLDVCDLISDPPSWKNDLLLNQGHVLNDCKWVGTDLVRKFTLNAVTVTQVGELLECNADDSYNKEASPTAEVYATLHSVFGPCVAGGSHLACPSCAVSDPLFWMIYADIDRHLCNR